MKYDLQLIQIEIKKTLIRLRVDPKFLLSFCEAKKTITIYSYNFDEQDLPSIKFALEQLSDEYKCKILLSPKLSILKAINDFDNIINPFLEFFKLESKAILKNEQLAEALNEPFSKINQLQDFIAKQEINNY